MTEVPDYLLQRSRDRRKALGLEGGESGAAAVPAVKAAAADVPAAATSAPVPATAPEPEPEVIKPDSPWVAAAKSRKKVPVWMAPVLLFTPIWMLMWWGTLEEPTREAEGPIAAGGAIYAQNCSSCHGGAGGGGVGRKLNEGEVLLTFPRVADHVWWVVNGSPAGGTPYGDPARPGGQHIAGETGQVMGNFAALGSAGVVEVTLYERVTHGLQEEAELEAWIAWVESGTLPEFPLGTTAEEIQTAFDAFLAENPALAEAEAALAEG